MEIFIGTTHSPLGQNSYLVVDKKGSPTKATLFFRLILLRVLKIWPALGVNKPKKMIRIFFFFFFL